MTTVALEHAVLFVRLKAPEAPNVSADQRQVLGGQKQQPYPPPRALWVAVDFLVQRVDESELVRALRYRRAGRNQGPRYRRERRSFPSIEAHD